jgi:hypothetical protein
MRMTVAALLLLLNLSRAQVTLEVLSPSVGHYETAHFLVKIPRQYHDPFDPTEVDLSLHVRTPAGKALQVPCFFCQDYELKRSERRGKLVLQLINTGAAGREIFVRGKARIRRQPSGEGCRGCATMPPIRSRIGGPLGPRAKRSGQTPRGTYS